MFPSSEKLLEIFLGGYYKVTKFRMSSEEDLGLL